MHVPRRGRIVGGIAAGAGAVGLFGSMVLGSPSGASETMYHHILKPEAVDDTPAAALVEGEQQVVGAAGAGSFVVQRVGDHLTIVAVSPASGWKVDVLHNDSSFVKAVFTNGTSLVFAAARLDDAGMVAVEAFEKTIPVKVEPVVKAITAARVKAAAFDGDHDGFCDHDGDGFRSASFG